MTLVRVLGLANIYLLGCIIAAILLSATWKPNIDITIRGVTLEAQNIVRDAIIVVVASISLKLTPAEHREANGFSWEPIHDVAKLFAAIFVCIIPMLAMLNAGLRGAFAWMLALTSGGETVHNLAYFWFSGILSGFLDNTPTYIMFFELAGGDACELMEPLAGTLAAIALSASHHGGNDLYRQCAEPDDLCHWGRAGNRSAELLHLHGVVERSIAPGLRYRGLGLR